MKNHFRNYSFSSNETKVSLNYKRSSKDYLDIVTLTILFTGCIAGTIFVYWITKDYFSINSVIILIFIWASIFNGKRLLSKIQEPTSNLLEINHKADKLIYRLDTRINKIIKLSEIRNLNYALIKTFHTNTNDNTVGKFGYYVQLNALLNSNKSKRILIIHPKNVFERNAISTEKELIKISKPLIHEISVRLNKTCSFLGIREGEIEY